MGVFSFLWRLFTGSPSTHHSTTSRPAPVTPANSKVSSRPLLQIKLKKLQRTQARKRVFNVRQEFTSGKKNPYLFARKSVVTEGYYNLSQDYNQERLDRFGLPLLKTPSDLADWFGISPGKLAWLIDRFTEYGKPVNLQQSHYHYRWLKKRKKGYRLLEIPKASLRAIQDKILFDILQKVPPHSCARGFQPGCSIKANALPHVGKDILIKYDLDNFYPRMRFSRVVAVFRGMGFSREAGIWLARLCTAASPSNLTTPGDVSVGILAPYTSRHLPQGAPTSPALANLCAYSLDLRLQGMARKFNLDYTRYADDITFSGDNDIRPRLKIFLPLVERIIQQERYTLNKSKRHIIRSSQRQVVTGIVVNEKLNCSKKDFDLLKAILTNCVKFGPQTQNRAEHPNFAEHLLGRIAHIHHLNPIKGNKLLTIYRNIRWS